MWLDAFANFLKFNDLAVSSVFVDTTGQLLMQKWKAGLLSKAARFRQR